MHCMSVQDLIQELESLAPEFTQGLAQASSLAGA